MKLHELDQHNQQDKAQQVLQARLGHTVSFANLTMRESRHMLLRVRGLLSEHRSTAAAHSSERDPAYLKLLMLESGLKGRLKEVAPVAPGQPAAGAVPIDTKDPKVQAAMKKSQSGQTLNPEEQKLVGAVAASAMQKESRQARRRLRESEIQQAQVVLAAQDMVDQIQKMLEQISAMQFKDLPALTDSIKNDMGVDQATAYQSATAAALTQLLQSVQQGKTALEGAQGTLTGQEPVVPGQEPAADMGADLNAEPAVDAEVAVDADVVPPADEEEPTPLGAPEALGRDRRVAEAKKGKKPDFLDLDKDGNKKETMKSAAAAKKKGVEESMDQPMSKILAKGYTSSQEHGDKQPRMSAKEKEAAKARQDARDAADMKAHYAKSDAKMKAAAKKKGVEESMDQPMSKILAKGYTSSQDHGDKQPRMSDKQKAEAKAARDARDAAAMRKHFAKPDAEMKAAAQKK